MWNVTTMTKCLQLCHGATVRQRAACPRVWSGQCCVAPRTLDDRNVWWLRRTEVDGATSADRSSLS